MSNAQQSLDHVIGIDIGTTSLKAIALQRERGVVASAEFPHELRSPRPGWAEEDAEAWWTTTRAAIRQLLEQVSAERIAAIGVSGMVPAMVLLDENGKPLRPSIQQNDARAIAEIAALRADVDTQEFFTITGGTVNQQNIDPRWRWLCHNEPETVARMAHLCGSYDFITFRLTGQRTLEENWAAESGLYNIREHRWHRLYLEHAGIRPDLLPPLHRPTDIVGGISPNVAHTTGLREGTPVIAGSADHIAAALAAGLTQNGDVLLKFGGAGDILYCADRADPDPHFYFDYHDIPGLTLINGCMAASGSLIKWFKGELASTASLTELDQEAAEIPAGAGGIIALPYFLGEKTPIFDPQARGVFAGVMLHHTRAHLYRAILEGVCYGFQHHLTILQAAGRPIGRVCAADGGSRSNLWMQMAADITGYPIEVIGGEAASALGVAFVAAMGAGMFDRWEAITQFISYRQIFLPRVAVTKRYQQGFRLYRELYTRLQPLLAELGQMEGEV